MNIYFLIGVIILIITAFVLLAVRKKLKDKADAFDDDIDALNTIAHEAFHVVFRIFKHCNVYLSEDTNEPYAFMTGWAAKNIYQTYKKAKK